MTSKILTNILERKISTFVGYFSEDSSKIFKDDKKILIHPGEYGKYKEEACKDLLRMVLDKSVALSDGFIINSKDEISTQIDIIVYNSNISPIIGDGISKMFPAEEIRMIGEIKSTLNKTNLKNALLKMANNKKMILNGRTGFPLAQVDENDLTYDTIYSFLICNKFDFNIDDLEYEEIYGEIDRKFWHNAILSVEDGICIYCLDLKKFPEQIRTKMKKYNFNPEISVGWCYSFYHHKGLGLINTSKNVMKIDEKNKYDHIKIFCATISESNQSLCIYKYDQIIYLGLENTDFYI